MGENNSILGNMGFKSLFTFQNRFHNDLPESLRQFVEILSAFLCFLFFLGAKKQQILKPASIFVYFFVIIIILIV